MNPDDHRQVYLSWLIQNVLPLCKEILLSLYRNENDWIFSWLGCWAPNMTRRSSRCHHWIQLVRITIKSALEHWKHDTGLIFDARSASKNNITSPWNHFRWISLFKSLCKERHGSSRFHQFAYLIGTANALVDTAKCFVLNPGLTSSESRADYLRPVLHASWS